MTTRALTIDGYPMHPRDIVDLEAIRELDKLTDLAAETKDTKTPKPFTDFTAWLRRSQS